jgi:hypothetical protein
VSNQRKLAWLGGMAVSIVILGALSWPVFHRAKDADPMRSCKSFLKSQGVGILLYSDDSDGRLPTRAKWMDKIGNYMHDEQAFHCDKVTSGEYGYAFNPTLAGASLNSSDANLPMIYDSVAKGRSAVAPPSSMPAPPRHEGENNVVYTDGRVPRLTKPNP